ncbi:ABC transporter permease [Bosea robiniae]|uniref:Spermidine/putrescine transport system permease protein n=1 Tax=Bosea robiniae TaxID=1036780 RepID=A0ABY0P7Y5_9HYPH|nr:ABC transporter permease [Bosea robiniae]SDH63486.1 putative spermidine/putrescine transport system permease protein [Bosea robiniae]
MSWLDRPASDTQISHGARLWLYAVGALVLAFLAIPTLIVIPMSFSQSQYLEFPPREWSLRWYEAYFASSSWMAATATSFKAGFCTALLATPMGTLAAYGLHTARLRFVGLAILALLTPTIVPVILVGIALFYAYVQLKMVNSFLGIVLAHTMLAVPIVMMIVGSALKSFDLDQERVARSLGATRTQAFLQVTAPQIGFALVTSAVLSFLTSFDEVVIALFVSGGDNATLTRMMFLALRDQIDPTIAAISTIMIVMTSLLLAVSQLFGKSET